MLIKLVPTAHISSRIHLWYYCFKSP